MRVILHIGQHKTGSKALQSALHANRSHLAARSIAYPVEPGGAGPLRPYEMNHHRLFAAVRAAVDEAAAPAALPGLPAMLDRLLAACPPATETMVLSAEDLFDMHTAHEAEFNPERIAAGSRLLARELAARGCPTRLVCYLRRQDHLLAAHYAQFIKGSDRHHPTLPEFEAAFGPRLDAEGILAHWEEAFGRAAITVAAYEPREMPGGIVADFFRRGLGLEPPPVTVPFPDDLEACNVTPSRDHLEYIRLLNRRTSRGKPVLSREHVLESAFRDRAAPAAGIAAWLSPAERAARLARHEPGNRRIATRHGLGEALFREPPPAAGDPWTSSSTASLARLVELDTRPRALATAAPAYGQGKRRRRSRLILWVVSPHASPADEAAAVELFASVAGCPGFESRVVPGLDHGAVPGRWRRAAFVVLVGPCQRTWRERIAGWLLACRGGKVVRLPGPLPKELLAA